jgi:predicted dehydrogenase
MNKRSLIIGMGIGQLYKTVLEKLGHEVITVDHDSSKGADFITVDSAIVTHAFFDTVHICTPNFTHFELAGKVAPYSKIVFIEKPGVSTSLSWQRLITNFPQTRFMMVKNNMWRSNISELKELADQAKTVNIRWIRRNCIPSPGSWFTTKKLAFGGVSRDLMPHLLSLYIALNTNWRTEFVSSKSSIMQWLLEDIDSTEYGTINPDGTYDVDDVCHIDFGIKWGCQANWRSMDTEDSSIEFIMKDNKVERFELGWCPEEAYLNMIKEAVERVDDYQFWLNQFDIDTWIHEKIENL